MTSPQPTGRHCAGCGYDEAYHEFVTLRCPGATRGKFREPAGEPRRQWFGLLVPYSPAELKAQAAAAEQPAATTGPPQVPARPPTGPGEIAGYQGKQAIGLGRHAAHGGWQVAALYWRAYDGTEGCAVQLAKGALRAVATWARKPGNIGARSGWSAEVAYAWRSDVERFPTRVTHTELEGLIR